MFKAFFILSLILGASAYADQMAGNTKEACMRAKSCWCSVKCGPRKMTKKDNPTFVENDAHGKYCYCKEWDRDHYKDNCIDNKNLIEPEDAR